MNRLIDRNEIKNANYFQSISFRGIYISSIIIKVKEEERIWYTQMAIWRYAVKSKWIDKIFEDIDIDDRE